MRRSKILAGMLILAAASAVFGFFGCGDRGVHKAAIYVTSDIHSNFTGLDTHMRLLAEKEDKIPGHVLTGGDYFVMGDNPGMKPYFDTMRESAHKHFSSETGLTVTMGNHDWQNYSLKKFEEESGTTNTGEQTNTELYTVYTVGYPDGNNCTGGMQDYYPHEVISGLDDYLTGMRGSGKVVFIQSHITLHNGKNSSNNDRTVIGSDKMVDMLNSHADYIDIVFFWGHCHSVYEQHRRTVKQSGDTISCITGEDNTPIVKTIKFTYANSGAMLNYQSNQSAAYLTFDNDSLTIKYYVLSSDQKALSLGTTYKISRTARS